MEAFLGRRIVPEKGNLVRYHGLLGSKEWKMCWRAWHGNAGKVLMWRTF